MRGTTLLQAFGVFNSSVYSQIASEKVRIDVKATSAAEVRTRLHAKHPAHPHLLTHLLAEVSAFTCVSVLVTASALVFVMQCVTLVRSRHPDASAAEYSNTGEVWCDAIFNA